jgi:hypothetical protein
MEVANEANVQGLEHIDENVSQEKRSEHHQET